MSGPGQPGLETPPHPGEPAPAAKPEVGRLPATLDGSHKEIERLRLQVTSMGHEDFNLLALTDADFQAVLEADKKRQERIELIVRNRLVEGKHYGNVKGITKKFLWLAGAEELRKLFRYTSQRIGEPIIESSKDYVAVTVTVGIYDSFGRLLCTRQGSCNTKERRFQSKNGGWIYVDAREQLHGCITMSEKRAGILGTREASGTSAIFAIEDELERVTEDPAADAAEPWTEEEKTAVFKAAAAVGIKSKEKFAEFVEATLGRTFVGTGDDVAKLLKAIEDRNGTGKHVADAGKSYAG